MRGYHERYSTHDLEALVIPFAIIADVLIIEYLKDTLHVKSDTDVEELILDHPLTLLIDSCRGESQGHVGSTDLHTCYVTVLIEYRASRLSLHTRRGGLYVQFVIIADIALSRVDVTRMNPVIREECHRKDAFPYAECPVTFVEIGRTVDERESDTAQTGPWADGVRILEYRIFGDHLRSEAFQSSYSDIRITIYKSLNEIDTILPPPKGVMSDPFRILLQIRMVTFLCDYPIDLFHLLLILLESDELREQMPCRDDPSIPIQYDECAATRLSGPVDTTCRNYDRPSVSHCLLTSICEHVRMMCD